VKGDFHDLHISNICTRFIVRREGANGRGKGIPEDAEVLIWGGGGGGPRRGFGTAEALSRGVRRVAGGRGAQLQGGHGQAIGAGVESQLLTIEYCYKITALAIKVQ
jgi:hypothetical protein